MCAVWTHNSRKRSFERVSRSFFHNCAVVPRDAASTTAGMNFQAFEAMNESLRMTIRLTRLLKTATKFDMADDSRSLLKKPVLSRFPPSELTFPFFIRIPYTEDGAFVKGAIFKKVGVGWLPIPKIRKLLWRPDRNVRRNLRTDITLWRRWRHPEGFKEPETSRTRVGQRRWHFETQENPAF